MAVKFSNNASTTLSAGISSGVTSFQVASNSGFPTLGGSDWTYVTISGSNTEVVKVTAISGTTFTCDATSEAHSNGDNVELRMTAELLNDFSEDTEALPLAGGTMTGDLSLGDNVKAQFGASDDLQIYHDGSNSIIHDNGTGNLLLKGDNLSLRTSGNESYLTGVANGAVYLYHNNSAKFETTSIGVDITGSVTADTSLKVGTIGAVGNTANDVNIYSTGSGHNGLRMHVNGVLPTDNTGTIVDADADLGDPNYRFKDLYLSGSVTCDGESITTTTDSDSTFTLTSSAVANNTQLRLGTSGNDSVISGSGGSTGALAFKVYGSEKMRIDSSGKVGIGTSSPAEDLHIKGAASAYTILRIESGSTSHGSTIEFADATDIDYGEILQFASSAGEGGRMRFTAGGTETMNLRGGNVGIGTSSPARGLQIHKEGNHLSLTTTASGTAAGNGSDFKVDASSSDLQILNYEASNTTLWTNGTERMRIDSSGNVGIGETSPAAKLHVSHGDSSTDLTDANNIASFERNGNARVVIATNSANTGSLEFGDSGGARQGRVSYAHSNDSLSFYTSGSERMRIDSSGNVGIGTSTPQAVTHIISPTNSTMALIVQNDVLGNAGEAWLGFKAQSSNDDERVKGAIVYQNQNSNTGVGDMLFLLDSAEDNGHVSTSQERMRIASSGSVGIGTDSPSAKLHIKTTASSLIGIGIQNSQRYYAIETESGGLRIKDVTAGALERMRIDSSGNVGIGTSSPSQKLHVVGKLKLTDDLQIGGTSPRIDYDGGSTGSLRFWSTSANTERMRIDSSGNVLVGTTSLTVGAGGSGVKGFRVDGTSGIVQAAASSNTSAIFNRTTSDGGIVSLRKDGSTVGSIGTNSTANFNITSAQAGHSGIEFGTAAILPTIIGTVSNGGVDLGISSARFKDLYLSGGVRLGGTAAANALDDYETGTWTPTLGGTTSNPTTSYYQQRGYYIKIGQLVHFEVFVQTSSTSGGSGTLTIEGLPFTVANAGSWDQSVATVMYHYLNRSGTDPQVTGEITNNDTRVLFMQSYDNSAVVGVTTTALTADGSWVRVSGNYRAA